MSKRAGILISDKRDNTSYRLYTSSNGEVVLCGRDLLDTIQEYIGRNAYNNLYDLYNTLMDSHKYELLDEPKWDEEIRYYINIVDDSIIELIATEIDWDNTANLKESTFKEVYKHSFNISEKPNYKIELNQQEVDFIKLHFDKIINDNDIKEDVKKIAQNIINKF